MPASLHTAVIIINRVCIDSNILLMISMEMTSSTTNIYNESDTPFYQGVNLYAGNPRTYLQRFGTT